MSTKIELAFDATEGAEFAAWLNRRGYDAKVGKTSSDFVDGVDVTLGGGAASEELCRLWDEYCNAAPDERAVQVSAEFGAE